MNCYTLQSSLRYKLLHTIKCFEIQRKHRHRYSRHRNSSATVAFRYQVGDKQGVGSDKDFVSLIWRGKGLLANLAAFSTRFLFRGKVLPLLTMDPWTAGKTFYEINPDWILSWTPTRCACNLTLVVPEVPSKSHPFLFGGFHQTKTTRNTIMDIRQDNWCKWYLRNEINFKIWCWRNTVQIKWHLDINEILTDLVPAGYQ